MPACSPGVKQRPKRTRKPLRAADKKLLTVVVLCCCLARLKQETILHHATTKTAHVLEGRSVWHTQVRA